MLLNPNAKLIIQNFIQESSEASMDDLIRFSKEFEFTFEEIAQLAMGLANSGKTIEANPLFTLYDIPSTGGPGSLSTLLSPLVLASFGKKILKLGVPGRPAGAIDCLAQIKNYNIEPKFDVINEWILSGNYVHIIANKNFTPLDIAFFDYRKKTNNLKIPALVIASILSKKIALGVTHVGLDVRISEFGNFGTNWEDARINSRLFNNVASLLGINSRCFITNCSSPLQPYFGRGESLLALYKIFKSEECVYLKKHANQCYSMAISLAGDEKYFTPILVRKLEEQFKLNLNLQGASFDSFLELVHNIELNHTYTFIAGNTGFLKIDLNKIRITITEIQQRASSIDYERFPDPCGINLKKNHMDYIEVGDTICTYRCQEKYYPDFKKSIEDSFGFAPVINTKYELEEII